MRRIIPTRHNTRTESSDEQLFPCSWPGCDAVFRAKFYLKNHLWRHTGERSFLCEWPGCEKRFAVKKNLVEHGKTHGTKNYKCDWPGCESTNARFLSLFYSFSVWFVVKYLIIQFIFYLMLLELRNTSKLLVLNSKL